MKLIAGLGNPGVQHQFNRHNMGFLALDRLAEAGEIAITQKKFGASLGKGFLSGHPVVLAKPQSYMNRSGVPLKKIFDYFRVALVDVIVVHDDLDLPFGTIRAKAGGGPGGHKGLISVIEQLGTADFCRIRLGIGKPDRKEMVEGYVLSAFSPDEMNRLPEVLARAAEMLVETVSAGIQAAMCKYHGKTINNFNEEV